MPIETNCFGCSRRLRVADEHAGKQARCPHCGTVYTVPAAPAPDPLSQVGTASTGGSLDQWRMRTEDGSVYGPVSKLDMDNWVTEGRVTANSQLQQGSGGWTRAAVLYPSLEPSAAASANPFADLGDQTNPYTSPQATAPRRRKRYAESHHGPAILILGIAGWFACAICSLVAVIWGGIDLAKMNRGEMDPEGRGMTMGGVVIGALNLVLQVLVWGFVIIMIALDAAG